MKIDRSNYELWLTDLLDGSLNENEFAILMAFLDANSDLKDEYEGLSGVYINKPPEKFHLKDQLKKSVSELTDSQFAHLCVAHLEKDLTLQQQAELNEIITNNPGRRREFQVFQKMVLSKPLYEYPGKKTLQKHSSLRPFNSLYTSILSAAAIIAFVIYYGILFKENKVESNILNAAILIDSLKIKEGPVFHSNRSNNNPETMLTLVPRNNSSTHNTPDQNNDFSIEKKDLQKIQMNDFLSYRSDFYRPSDSENDLIDIKAGKVPPSVNERSRIGSFLAREYRGIVLKEKKASDKPIEGFEIAEGGIKGLNKLLGWEMALEKNNDENGNLRSVHFNSKILKISTPVKKTKPRM